MMRVLTAVSTAVAILQLSPLSSGGNYFAVAVEAAAVVEADFFKEQPSQQQLIRGGGSLVGATSTSCADHHACHNCTKATGCHWCDFDQACHVIGSVYGCAVGAKCHGDDNKKKDDNRTRDACNQYPTCIECGKTHTCHWCAHDNSCHTIGSFYGCARGVDCYSNDRCLRKVPEPLPDNSFTNMGALQLILSIAIGTLTCCSLSICFCCARGMKGAYDDLLVLQQNTTTEVALESNNHTEAAAAMMATTPEEEGESFDTAADSEAVLATPEEQQQQQSSNNSDTKSGTDAASNVGSVEEEYGLGEAGEVGTTPEQQQQPEEADLSTPLLPRTTTPAVSDAAAQASETTTTTSTRSNSSSKHMSRLMGFCTCLYLFAILSLGGGLFLAVRFYPNIPDYQVCNDAVAWKKLVTSLATLNTEVDVEILLSIENANHVGMALEEGRGVFKYNGDVIGHYIIPPALANPMSITDVLVIATAKPKKWETVEIAKDFVEGTLVLQVDIELKLRIPWLFNYSHWVKISNFPVDASQDADRHLCHCKDWDNNSTKSVTNNNALVLPPSLFLEENVVVNGLNFG